MLVCMFVCFTEGVSVCHVCKRVCACMFLCLYVSSICVSLCHVSCVCMCARVCVCAHICVCICVRACLSICPSVCLSVYLSNFCMFCLYVCLRACISYCAKIVISADKKIQPKLKTKHKLIHKTKWKHQPFPSIVPFPLIPNAGGGRRQLTMTRECEAAPFQVDTSGPLDGGEVGEGWGWGY